MTINQVYSVVNSLANNMEKGQYNVVDYSSFVNFGTAVLSSSTNREAFYNSLVDRIGRTIIAIKDYKAVNRGVMVDTFTFGSILQKISFKYQNAEESSKWGTTSANPYDVNYKGGVIQKLFAQNMPVYAYTDVILNNQLESAFTNPTTMAAFFNGLYTRMYNAYEVSKEELEATAINAFMSDCLKTSAVINAERRARNLLKEYNTKYGTELTKANCLTDVDFLRYAVVEIQTVIEYLSKPSILYNDGTVERHYSPEDLTVEFISKFTKEFENSLATKALNSQWRNVVELPNYRTTPYWVSETEPYFLAGTGINEELVIGCIRAKDGCVATLERERFVSHYDEWNARNQIKLEGERRYCIDTSEAIVVFYIDDEETRYDVTFTSSVMTIGGAATYKMEGLKYLPNFESLTLSESYSAVKGQVTTGSVTGFTSKVLLSTVNKGLALSGDVTITLSK